MQENYPTLRAHVGVFSNPGTASADFRGPNFIGAAQGDQHRTAFEIDNPSEELIQAFLAFATEQNAKTCKEVSPGVWVGERLGVWDKYPPADAA